MSLISEEKTIVVCKWCGRRLGTEYYWKCRQCGQTYCYVHSSRHKH